MSPCETTWTDVDGVEHTVTTYPAPGQTERQKVLAHEGALQAAQQIWPPQ